ncbi:MAG: hypothetical protein U0M42_00835 [Acutalibacteraceae bacterium]|nr:hypothetical protein [Acutalibacteraceae bacterium]
MARKKIETIINERISPYSLNDIGKADISQIVRQYPYELLLECIDIGVSNYFKYDEKGCLTKESVDTFLNKIGGIAYNKSRTPVEQEIYHLKNKGNYKFSYWNSQRADDLLHDYVQALYSQGWSENMVLDDLREDSALMMNKSNNWSDWRSTIEQWIYDVKHWNEEDNVTVEQLGTVLPDALFCSLPSNVQSLCKQINASYENNLFDCTAVIMRRLLESLLVLSYQKAGIESDIMNGNYHVTLDKIIKNAEQNITLALSSNTKKDMALFKDLGNYSAHKIWYNCTQGDIKPHVLKYRAIIEELMYKSGLK